MTEKQLINQIKQLKGIKPRQEWVILAKSQLFASEPAIGNWEIGKLIVSLREMSRRDKNWKLKIGNSFARRLAYSFVTLVFVIIGLIGFANHTMPGDLLFPIKKITEQSQASLSGQTKVKQEIATLNNRINDLAQATKQGKKNNIPSAINEISAKASIIAKTLKEEPAEDTETLNDIAKSLQVLAYVPGTDLSKNSEVKELYQAVVVRKIADLENSTLTEEQEEILLLAKEFYEKEDYVEALKVLTVEKHSAVNDNGEDENNGEENDIEAGKDKIEENITEE